MTRLTVIHVVMLIAHLQIGFPFLNPSPTQAVQVELQNKHPWRTCKQGGGKHRGCFMGWGGLNTISLLQKEPLATSALC